MQTVANLLGSHSFVAFAISASWQLLHLRRLSILPSTYRLEYDSPGASELFFSVLLAAAKTHTRLIDSKYDNDGVSFTFDNNVDQSMIVCILSDILKQKSL